MPILIDMTPPRLDVASTTRYPRPGGAAVAVLRAEGAERVAVVDFDVHHGNGTQDIFYDRGDVLFISIHGRPEEAFPHFLGYADETGVGQGEGANLNIPLPEGTDWAVYADAQTANPILAADPAWRALSGWMFEGLLRVEPFTGQWVGNFAEGWTDRKSVV